MIPNKINLHKLDDLFFELDNNIQQQVQSNVITKMQESLTNYNDKDFKNDLQQNNNIFVEWRYFFEGNSKSVNYPFLFKLMETLREVAISIR